MPTTATITLSGYIMPDDWLFPGDGYYPPEPGISLVRVQAAIKAAGSFDDLLLDIDSGGGVIEEGWRIYDWVKTLNVPVKTRTVGVVASMAAILMMLGSERMMSPHAKFIVHQPGGGLEGNINDFQEYLNGLIAEQTRLVNVYTSGTGKAEEEIAALLADGKDHEFTAQQALAYGWITGIYETSAAPAAKLSRKPMMAHLSDGRKGLNLPEHKQPQIDMTKLTGRLGAAWKAIEAAISGAPMTALLVDTADGKKLNIEAAGDSYVIGDAVTFEDGAAVPDGDYILSDGNTIAVAAGIIADIKEPEAAAEAEAPAAVVESEPIASVEETVTISKAEFERLSGLDSTVASMNAKVTEHEKFMARMKPVMEAMSRQESADPIVAKLPETSIDKRVPAPEESAVDRKKARLAARK